MHYRVLKSNQKSVLNMFKNLKTAFKNHQNFKIMLKLLINFCDSQIVYRIFEPLLMFVTIKSHVLKVYKWLKSEQNLSNMQ